MRILKKITIFVFCIILLLPVFTFNTKENAISEIDNRALAQNPLTADSGEDFTTAAENYVNDRIGFRNEMILDYTILNDKLFGKMVHPSYTYGKDGYVFGAGLDMGIHYNEYHEVFADMVKKVQDYCDERGIPFLFVFNPAKPAVMTEYIAEGINYNREWVDEFLAALEERGIRYLDNTETLKAVKDAGENAFNKKYDANHWNDTGAYYGTNAMLEKLKQDIPTIHVNTDADVTLTEQKQESLLVSRFPIDEMVPVANIAAEFEDLSESYSSELELDQSYNAFGYYLNPQRIEEGAPKALVFQGSYMNVYGYRYLQNAFGQYIYVHDYQNILNFPYYYNIFKPDCVIFEVAEYTLSDGYFNFEKMKELQFNSPYSAAVSVAGKSEEYMPLGDIKVSRGETLTKLEWTCTEKLEQAWMLMGNSEYDLIRTKTGYTVTVLTEEYDKYKDELEVAGFANGTMMHWRKETLS